MIKRRLTLLAAFVVLSVTLFAQMLPPQSMLQNDTTVVYGKLENGLTYYIKHNAKPAQRADFWIITDVGAIQESPAQDGLAHFLEHMCFNGTKNFPEKGIISYMESIGAKFGENINAGTGVEATSYMLNNIPVIRDGIVDTSLLVLHDWSAFVTNDPQEIDNERGVILEEKRTRNNAQWRTREALFGALFKDSKYANCSIIGSEENLKNFKPEELVNFYKTWYRPDMQAIVVVGDVDVKKVEERLKVIFSDIPRVENGKAKDVITIPDNEEPIVAIFTDKEYPATSVDLFMKTSPTPKEYRGMGINVLMNLYKEMVSLMMDERFTDIASQQDAPFLNASVTFMKMCATMECFNASVQAKDGEALKSLKAMYVELERARRFGFTDAEFERAKTNILRRYERAAENGSSRMNSQIVNSLSEHFLEGIPYSSPEYINEVVKGYINGGAIQLDAINKFMQALSFDKNSVIFFASPEKEGLAVPAEADLLQSINEAKAEEIKPLEGGEVESALLDPAELEGSKIKSESAAKFGATKIVLENGIEIYIKPTEFNKDEVVIKSVGTGGKSILADELLPSLERNIYQVIMGYAGISDFPVTKLQKMLTGKTVQVTPYIQSLEQGVNASGSPKDIETMLQLLYLYYAEPRFEESEIAVGLNQIGAILPNIEKQPDFILQSEITKTLYGNSPRVPVLDSKMVENVSVERFKEAYCQLFDDAAKLKVYISGNVDVGQIKPLLEKYIGSLPVKSKNGKEWRDDKSDIVKGKVENIFAVPMETPKSTVALVYSGEMKTTLENKILASALEYILNMTYTKTIREDEGGTYGVGVSLQLSKRPKEEFVLFINFDTDKSKAGRLIELAVKGLEDIAENGVDEDYISKTKENFVKAHPEKHIRNGYWIGLMEEMYGENKMDNESGYLDMVEKCVTSDNIKRMASSMIGAGNMIKLVMNPKE